MMRVSILAICVLVVSGFSSVSVASDGDLVYEGAEDSNALIVLSEGKQVGEFGMPCRPETLYRVKDRLVATCTDKPGLLIVDISSPDKPTPVEIRAFAGRITRVYRVGDDLWADVEGEGSRSLKFESKAQGEESREESQRPTSLKGEVLEQTTPEEAPTTPDDFDSPREVKADDGSSTEEEKTDPSGALGQVTAVRGSTALIDLGADDGLRHGNSVEFFKLRQMEIGGETIQKEVRIGNGRVESTSEKTSVVKIGLNVPVSKGVKVRIHAKRFWPWIAGPPRTAGVTELSLTVRPFLPLGTIGAGAIMDVVATHRFEKPVAVTAMLSPIGFAFTNKGDAGVFAGHVIVSYDTRIFQVGLGIGASRFTDDNLPYIVPEGESLPSTTIYGFSGAQYVRFGPRDGLNLTAMTHFVAKEEEFDFGGFSAEVLVPLLMLLDGSWIVVRGGAGLPGHTFGEVGLRTRIKGTGHRGSLFVTPTLGGANVETKSYESCGNDGERCVTSQNFGGPMVGMTLDWRF